MTSHSCFFALSKASNQSPDRKRTPTRSSRNKKGISKCFRFNKVRIVSVVRMNDCENERKVNIGSDHPSECDRLIARFVSNGNRASDGNGAKKVFNSVDAREGVDVESAVVAAAVAVGAAVLVMFPVDASLAMIGTATASAANDSGVLVEEASGTGGFAQAFLLILLSELGDKTFFISLLLALKEKKSAVFLGTFGALAVMTALSVCIGQVFHVAEGSLGMGESAIPFDDILAVLLLLYFGINTIKGAEDAGETADEEKEEAKVEIGKMQFSGDQALILSTFALVFAAEWGDKSFFATIALSAAQDPTQVFLGGAAGHAVATGLAVLTGELIGEYLSEKVVAYTGGGLFIAFAIATLGDIVSKLQIVN
jgi:putative Ca2+/H+ antiporter (TMEM165/GDT1 family)